MVIKKIINTYRFVVLLAIIIVIMILIVFSGMEYINRNKNCDIINGTLNHITYDRSEKDSSKFINLIIILNKDSSKFILGSDYKNYFNDITSNLKNGDTLTMYFERGNRKICKITKHKKIIFNALYQDFYTLFQVFLFGIGFLIMARWIKKYML